MAQTVRGEVHDVVLLIGLHEVGEGPPKAVGVLFAERVGHRRHDDDASVELVEVGGKLVPVAAAQQRIWRHGVAIGGIVDASHEQRSVGADQAVGVTRLRQRRRVCLVRISSHPVLLDCRLRGRVRG